jgi:hypothetical protein
MEFLLDGEEKVATVQIIESTDRMLILGNDWLEENEANIDMKKRKIRIKDEQQGYVNIPVEYKSTEQKKFKHEDEDSEEEYEEEDLQEARL